MASHSLKMLIMFIGVVAFINFTYYAANLKHPIKYSQSQIIINKIRQDPYLTVDFKTFRTSPTPDRSKLMMILGEQRNVDIYRSYLNKDNENYILRDTTDIQTDYVELDMASPCPENPPRLGPTNWKSFLIPSFMDKVFSRLDLGGWFRPNCVPKDRVAIIVPFSGDESHIKLFLVSMHLFMMKQMTAYQIFLIKDISATNPLNSGKLNNIGFIEVRKRIIGYNWTCVIFHDEHLAPRDSRNLYRCGKQPKILVSLEDVIRVQSVDVGGAIAVTTEDFLTVNGFSNSYSDSRSLFLDIFDRLNVSSNWKLQMPSKYAKYDTILERQGLIEPATDLPPLTSNTFTSQTKWYEDGLSSLSYSNYSVTPMMGYSLIEVKSSELDSNLMSKATRTKSSNPLYDETTVPSTTPTLMKKSIFCQRSKVVNID